MKNPCKYCLVKPACTEDCENYEKYLEKSSTISTVLIMVLSAILFFILLVYGCDLLSKEPNKELIKLIWLLVAIPNLVINHKLLKCKIDEQFNRFGVILAGPFVTFIFTFIFFFAYFNKRNSRKRV